MVLAKIERGVYAQALPESHVISKDVGQLVTASWDAFNEGPASNGFLELIIDSIAAPNSSQGVERVIASGQPGVPVRSPLSLAYVVPGAALAGTYRAHLSMYESNGAGAKLGSALMTHHWDLVVSIPVPVGLVAVGDPTIT